MLSNYDMNEFMCNLVCVSTECSIKLILNIEETSIQDWIG